MLRLSDIRLHIDHSEDDLKTAILEALGIGREDLLNHRICKKSADARKRNAIFFNYSVIVEVADEESILKKFVESRKIGRAPDETYRFAGRAPDPLPFRPVVVGAGPCGLFAALTLARTGFRPILLERGKSMKERARDVALFWRTGILNPQSNALFGEGGAGTFSDGKLVTQIKDRENRCRKVLEDLVAAGAPEEILYLNKPHVGTDRLVKVIANLRQAILSSGGEVRFENRVADILVEEGGIRGVVLDTGEKILSRCVIAAIGHSARDTFEMLSDKGVVLEPKSFSIGLRIEHPQKMIDAAQYGRFEGHPKLGAADYKLTHHCSNGRSAYTFCMCPGGSVIAATSETGCVVTNGMSPGLRNRPNANSALLVGVVPSDFPDSGPLAGVAFQRRWEQKAFELGGGNYNAPAQLVADFLASRGSKSFGEIKPSYKPGVTLCDLAVCLPPYVTEALREAIPIFGRKIKGFSRPDAVLTGVETRSSSPVRITRGQNMESLSVAGLIPAGEGAGYAGGIISSAVDGIKAAEAVTRKYCKN
ncbi:MAG: FAD-dependent monooxygenase [Acidobacteria bacterium]|nr:FAD-dependent monooxygenase [Acidobacteriota bacterium]